MRWYAAVDEGPCKERQRRKDDGTEIKWDAVRVPPSETTSKRSSFFSSSRQGPLPSPRLQTNGGSFTSRYCTNIGCGRHGAGVQVLRACCSHRRRARGDVIKTVNRICKRKFDGSRISAVSKAALVKKQADADELLCQAQNSADMTKSQISDYCRVASGKATRGIACGVQISTPYARCYGWNDAPRTNRLSGAARLFEGFCKSVPAKLLEVRGVSLG